MEGRHIIIVILYTTTIVYITVDRVLYHREEKGEPHIQSTGSKIKYRPTPIILYDDMPERQFEVDFFKYVTHTSYKCSRMVRVGHAGDGGWNVCLDPPFQVQKPCLVLSFGIKDDWSFDDAISQKFGCQVHSFDPSISREDHQRSPLVSFHNLGLSGKVGINNKNWSMETLTSVRDKLNLQNTIIDILKVDIERSEFSALTHSLLSGELNDVRQLVFELHAEVWRQEAHRNDMKSYELLRNLELMGFRKFHYNANYECKYTSYLTSIRRTKCHELYYINSNFIL